MRRRLFNLVGLVAMGQVLLTRSSAAKTSKSSPDETGFATPEDAVQHIGAALRRADMVEALSGFDIDRRVSGYSFVKMAERLSSMMLTTMAPPTRYGFYQEAARAQFTADISSQLRNLAYSLLAPTGTVLDRVIGPNEVDDIGQYATELEAALDPARLITLRVLQSAVPVPQIANSEQYRRTIAQQLAVTGGDDQQERLVLYEIDGRTYRGGITLVRYGDRWLIRNMMSALGGTSALGHALAMSADEFEASLRGVSK